MAIVPGAIRVQAVFQGVSALPEDRYVNTWHFADTGGGPTVEADLQAAIDKLQTFYFANEPTTGTTVIRYMARTNFNQALSHFRAYDLSLPEPREPLMEVMDTFGASGPYTPLPSEVAACLSFHGVTNTPSTRGRIYLGPLNIGTIETGSSPAIIDPMFITTFTKSAERLRATAGGPIWSILTNPGGAGPNMVTVLGGWVDNAFDTQRRRGEDATERFPWGL
jgi:hypothetical protein